ncbi:hypothetical protein KKD03_01150 [Patescibacteria group bacterium]|nr:hypothetical protein [Patescibacteria group bacterium]
MNKYTIAISGSTKRTALCAETLKNDGNFEIVWILTPEPKPVGRKKIIIPNPLDIFAKENKVPVIYIEKKIDESVAKQISITPDFLLVVDFGYKIPDWLLGLPKIAPLNIHPSELPKWRGNSPGQFSILFNDKKSAVTLMKINNKFDQGPIIHQDFFEINKNWNHENYYSHAFKLMCNGLGKKIAMFTETKEKQQPEKSTTMIANKLKKEQTFVTWKVVKIAMNMNGEELDNGNPQLSKLLLVALEHNRSLALTLERASKAFFPWPSLWTIVPTQKGEKRMKLLDLKVETEKNLGAEKLILKTVHIEGNEPRLWNDVKNSIIE